jgi:hypothetical protein
MGALISSVPRLVSVIGITTMWNGYGGTVGRRSAYFNATGSSHVVLVRRPGAARRGLWPWIARASKRLHRNMLAIALANKLARIAWAVLARGDAYQPRIAVHAAS